MYCSVSSVVLFTEKTIPKKAVKNHRGDPHALDAVLRLRTLCSIYDRPCPASFYFSLSPPVRSEWAGEVDSGQHSVQVPGEPEEHGLGP